MTTVDAQFCSAWLKEQIHGLFNKINALTERAEEAEKALDSAANVLLDGLRVLQRFSKGSEAERLQQAVDEALLIMSRATSLKEKP